MIRLSSHEGRAKILRMRISMYHERNRATHTFHTSFPTRFTHNGNRIHLMGIGIRDGNIIHSMGIRTYPFENKIHFDGN